MNLIICFCRSTELKKEELNMLNSTKELGSKKIQKKQKTEEKKQKYIEKMKNENEGNIEEGEESTQNKPEAKQNVVMLGGSGSFIVNESKVDLSTGVSDKKPIVQITKKKKRRKKKYDVTFENNPNSNPKSKLLFYKDDSENEDDQRITTVNNKSKPQTNEKVSRKEFTKLQVENLKLNKKNRKKESEESGNDSDANHDSEIEVVVNDSSEESETIVKKGNNQENPLLENWEGEDNQENMDDEENEENEVDESEEDKEDDSDDFSSSSDDSESKTFSEDSIYLMEVPIIPTSQTSNIINYTKTFVSVNRPENVIESRKQLPIFSEESRILETIEENDIIIVCGETGFFFFFFFLFFFKLLFNFKVVVKLLKFLNFFMNLDTPKKLSTRKVEPVL